VTINKSNIKKGTYLGSSILNTFKVRTD